MGTSALVYADIEKGKAVLAALDDAGLTVRTAFWLYADEAWRLVLATPLVDKEGLRGAYQAVQKALARGKREDLVPLSQIQVFSPGDPLIRNLSHAVRTSKKDVADIRFTNNVINNMLIEDAYVYRST